MYVCMTESLFHTSYLSAILKNHNLRWIVRNSRKLDCSELTKVHNYLNSKPKINSEDINLLAKAYRGLSEAEEYLARKYGVPKNHPLENSDLVSEKNFGKEFFDSCTKNNNPIDNQGAVIFLDAILGSYWIDFFENRIVNAHSAVLPHARGMYAIEQLISRGNKDEIEAAAGATIHYVDSGIDTGSIIYKKNHSDIWGHSSIWALKGESYILAFSLIESYLNRKEKFTLTDGAIPEESVENTLFYSRDFTDERKNLSIINFEKIKEGCNAGC